MKGLSKRGVQLGLGTFWLLDGLLQLQPRMFTKAFMNSVILPGAQGQPGFVSGPIHLGAHIFLTQPVVFNSLFALTQIVIGALIIYKRSVRLGLILSVLWGIVVWVLGEAYGGIFSGHTSLLMGAPGAVLLYIVLSFAAMPRQSDGTPKQNQVAYWLVLIWAVFWVGGGIYQLLPGQNTTGGISSMISMNASSAPKWLASLDNNAAKVVKNLGGTTTHIETAQEMHMSTQQMSNMSSPAPVITASNPGYWFIILLSLLQMLIGFCALLSGLWHKVAIYLGICLSLIFWVIGQNIGGLYSGLATDPGAGPLFVLMGLAILGQKDINKRLVRFEHIIENMVTGSKIPAK